MACSAPLHQLLAYPSARAPNMAESEVVGAKMMGDYANFINTGHRNFIRVLIPHQLLRKIRIYGFLWHPMSSSMQLWNVSPPEYLISISKDFNTIGPDALIRPATHGGLPVGWKKIRVDRPLELLSTDGDFSPEKFQLWISCEDTTYLNIE